MNNNEIVQTNLESPTISSEFKELLTKIKAVQEAIKCVLDKLSGFKILDETLVPEGLKPHARSVTWLVQQIVVQNLRKFKDMCGLEEVRDPPHDLTQYDCVLMLKGDKNEYFVNLKTSLATTNLQSRFDVSKADGLIKSFEEEKDLILLVAIVKVNFTGVHVKFTDLVVFNVAWISDTYYNRANHNLQTTYDGTLKQRSNDDFVKELKRLMEQAGHLKHY